MKYLRNISAAVIAAAVSKAYAFEQLTIQENGLNKTVYIVGNTDYEPKGGDRIVMEHNTGYQLTRSDYYGPDNFYGVNLLGGSIEYDVDLSQSGCSCNAAFTLVYLPAKDEKGNPSAGPFGTYYCDANNINNQWCPEFDIMEANTYAWRTTPHKCDPPNSNDHFYNCDRQGSCIQEAWTKL